MSLTAAQLRQARDSLREAVVKPQDYKLTIDQVVSLMLAVEAAQGLAPEGLTKFVEQATTKKR